MERSLIIRWLVLFGVFVALCVGVITTLNVTLYSASGFVSSYLGALGRHDVDSVLRMPGVSLPAQGSRALVRPDALADLSAVTLVDDVDAGRGIHTVTYSYLIGGEKARSTFRVEHTGPRLGLFSGWRFVESPVSTLRVTPLHAADFEANGLPETSKAGAGLPQDFTVLTPARVALRHSSTYLTARTTGVVLDSVGAIVQGSVDIEASPAFVKAVQTELDAALKACVTQKVLLPTGCPMGTQITDRIESAPVWSMVTYPEITITPGESAGNWRVPATTGVAHLTVPVRSIFDGSVSTFDKDVSFDVEYTIVLDGAGGITISPV